MNVGFAMCGSFCTYSKVFPIMEQLSQQHKVIPIFSEVSCHVDSRFGTAQEHMAWAKEICGMEPLHTIDQVEPIGPKKLLDILVIAPCTGNTAAKLAAGITDGAVTMAAKAHLRNGRPVVLALASNDGLSGGAKNIGELLNRKNYFFVPFGQDDPVKKPCSLVADFTQIVPTIEGALRGEQIQPVLLR